MRDLDIFLLIGLALGIAIGVFADRTLACAHAEPAHVTILSCRGQVVVMGRERT